MAGVDRRLFQSAAHYQVELNRTRMCRSEPEPFHRTVCPAQQLRLHDAEPRLAQLTQYPGPGAPWRITWSYPALKPRR
jgi:hypothetical protein